MVVRGGEALMMQRYGPALANMRSIRPAMMKSFSCSPLIFFVRNETFA